MSAIWLDAYGNILFKVNCVYLVESSSPHCDTNMPDRADGLQPTLITTSVLTMCVLLRSVDYVSVIVFASDCY
jgi:hypothetical protein